MIKEETVSPGCTLADKIITFSLLALPIVNNGIFWPMKLLPREVQ